MTAVEWSVDIMRSILLGSKYQRLQCKIQESIAQSGGNAIVTIGTHVTSGGMPLHLCRDSDTSESKSHGSSRRPRGECER